MAELRLCLSSSQGGPALDALRSAKGFAEDPGGMEAGPLPNLMAGLAGSNSLMRPRSQQFPQGGSTDSERCPLSDLSLLAALTSAVAVPSLDIRTVV